MDDYFRDSDVIHYGNFRIQSCCMLFQDDVIHLSNSRDNTQSAVTRMESVMKSKQLEVHPDKTCCVVIGDSGVTNKIKDELLSRPIIYDDFVVKNEVESK